MDIKKLHKKPDDFSMIVCTLKELFYYCFTFSLFERLTFCLMWIIYQLLNGCFIFCQVRRLNSTIVEKKSSLAPIIKELRPMRQKCQVRLFCHYERGCCCCGYCYCRCWCGRCCCCCCTTAVKTLGVYLHRKSLQNMMRGKQLMTTLLLILKVTCPSWSRWAWSTFLTPSILALVKRR